MFPLCPFWPISNAAQISRLCPNSLKLNIVWNFFQNEFLKYLNKCAHETGRKSSNNPATSKLSNQSKICSKFQRCIYNLVENFSFCLLNCKKISIVDASEMTDTSENDDENTKTTSITFLRFYCRLWTNFVHWFSCIFNIFQKFSFKDIFIVCNLDNELIIRIYRLHTKSIYIGLVWSRWIRIISSFQKFMFPLFWTSKRHLGRVSKTEKNRWLNTLLKCSIRKSFGIKIFSQITTRTQE